MMTISGIARTAAELRSTNEFYQPHTSLRPVFFEVLYFVTIVSDCLCQSSGTRSLYLRHREGAQKKLLSVLPAIVGEVNVSEVDAGLAERSTQYGTDPPRAAAVLSTFVDGQIPTPSMVFAKAALGYVTLSHLETFGRMILPRGQVSGGCGRPTIAAAARWSERTPAQ